MSKKKYKKGKVISNFYSVLMRIELEGSFYYRHKFMHYKFIEHWSVVQIRKAVKYGHLFIADKIRKEDT